MKFLPVDRINTIIAVAPNPGVFPQVKEWIEKLDIPVKITAGAINNYVYRLKYGRAETVAMAIMALYTGNVSALMNLAMRRCHGRLAWAGGMGYGGGMGTAAVWAMAAAWATAAAWAMAAGMGGGGYGGWVGACGRRQRATPMGSTAANFNQRLNYPVSTAGAPAPTRLARQGLHRPHRQLPGK